jgi:hypothetical protein
MLLPPELAFLIFAIAFNIWVYSHFRERKPPKFKVRMQDIWDYTLPAVYKKEMEEDDMRILHACIGRLGEEGMEQVKEDLLWIEMTAEEQEHPLRFVKEQILDFVDLRTLGLSVGDLDQGEREELGLRYAVDLASENRIKKWLAETHLKIATTRYWAQLKYKDWGKNDWLGYYERVSQKFHERLMERIGESEDTSLLQGELDRLFLEPRDPLFQEARERCLNAKPGQKFEIPADGDSDEGNDQQPSTPLFLATDT